MSSPGSAFASSATRPLRLRMRADLTAQRQVYQGRSFWVVKDPVALKYYRFHDEEYALLELIDGQRSLEQIRRQFERRFPPQKITLPELTSYVGSLHRGGLVISDAPGQARPLLERRSENNRKKWLELLGSVLSMRFRGFDPDRLLTWLDRRLGWMFSWPMTVAGVALITLAALLVTIRFDTFYAKLPAFDQFFAAENWLWLAITLGATKVLHEFGHGLVCKRLGGQCHEMGVMLLVMTPCLYVNVSDSWMLPNKWHRAAIAAAGMYVELVLASICTFVWWFSEPGLLNYLCLNVMFVSSVSTVMFNANPLMRYDGYYILADLLEIPNLRTKATTVLQRLIGTWCLGWEQTPDPFLPQHHQLLFAAYSVAAAVYRWIVTFSILWFLHRVFEPWGLQVVGQILAVIAIWGLLLQPIWQLVQLFRVPGRMEKVNKKRAMISAAVLVAVVAALLFVPLPYWVECPLRVMPRGAASVYVEVPGQLQAIHARGGEQVSRGTPLVTLTSADIDLAVAKLAGEREQLAARVEDLQRRQFQEAAAALEIAEAQESLNAIEEQLEQRRRDLDSLQVIAPADGTVLPPPRAANAPANEIELPTWSGTPLEPHNLGATLEPGQLICMVGQPGQLEAVIDVDQSQVEFIRPGQKVRLKFAALPGDTFVSEIAVVGPLPRETQPAEERAAAEGEGGVYRKTLTTKYQASAPLDHPPGILAAGSSGAARIRAGYLTLGQRAWRYFSHTFRFTP
jgi:putative peptide zinc metalloprotease protein